ncbi:MAG: hypothetical protein IJ902_02150 [Prevotella sp.]|nr:hypothetical protein [Prevotella sp.]
MKRLLLLLLCIVSLLHCKAQAIVCDVQDGQPVIQASVYDEQGKIIGVTDADGRLPDLADVDSIRITHIAYYPLQIEVGAIKDVIRMRPLAYSLKEVVKEKKSLYCLRLRCYHRQYMVNGKGTLDKLPPVVSFVDGLCNLYIFVNGWHESRRVTLARREVITGDQLQSSAVDEVVPTMSPQSIPELKEDFPSSTTIQRDSQIIRATFDGLYPDRSRRVSLRIADEDGKYKTVAPALQVKDLRQGVYRVTPYPRVSQGDLLAYCEISQLKGRMTQRRHESYTMNLWLFDEYYPIEAEYLTRQEYKAEDIQPLSMTIDDIDHYIQEIQVPALSDDLQRKLDETRRQRHIQKQTPYIEVGQRKGKLLIQLHGYEGTDSLICTVTGNGNDIVSDYNQEKVLRIDSEMLKAGEVTISIKNQQTGMLIAETKNTIRMENASIELQEVSVTGSKKKKKTPVLNPYKMDPPRGFKPGDPKIGQANDMKQLLTSLGIRVNYYDGEPNINTPENAGLDIYVDNMNMNDDHDYVLNLVPANVKAIEYFTPNNATNGIFGVRPQSFTGKVPGVLFIFLNDGSEVVNP